TLVATSCVEAGMDFSFRTGFRERASAASLIQIGGRVNRENIIGGAEVPEVWDLLLRDDQFRSNPSVSVSCRALSYFALDELNGMKPSELATIAMRREWTSGAEEKARQLIEHENGMEYPSVSKESRVIDTDTRTVIIDKSLADAVQRSEKVSRVEIMKYSVQIRANKIDKLALEPITHDKQASESALYFWGYEYESDFLGYMKGVLKLDEFVASGGAII
ncbi:MAG: CRISPR-associated protein, partial [Candidatus Peregrinibacteria bacterium]